MHLSLPLKFSLPMNLIYELKLATQGSFVGYDDQNAAAQTPGAISERGGPASPWTHEDYEFPSSVGPVCAPFPPFFRIARGTMLNLILGLSYALQQDEQQTDETYEQFEERVLNKRAALMYTVIKTKLETKDRLTLSEMAYKNSRKQAAQKFYTLLVLKKFQVLELNQQSSYADIFVTRGPKFENPAL